MSLLQMTLSGSCIILLAALLRWLALYRLPKQTFITLWLIAALRMLLPIELPSRWSIFALFAHRASMKTGERIIARAKSVDTAVQMQTTVSFDWCMLIWLAGMVICAVFFMVGWLRSMRRFRTAIPVQSKEVEVFLKSHPLKRNVRVRCCEFISAPLTYGLLCPVILLPDEIDAENLELILCHEWAHIHGFDVLKKAILVAAVCVNWFNPLAWLMLSLANRDIELACDEKALHFIGNRRSYAMALISMEESRTFVGSVISCFSKNQTEERIIAIMKSKNKTALSMIIAVLLVLGTVAAFATTAPENLGDLYAEYEQFGLIYNEANERLYFNGRLVRYFEDMYPTEDNGEETGILVCYIDGEVDVRAVRDLSGEVRAENFGKLFGVEACSQEEFDARTSAMLENRNYTAERTVIITGKNGEVVYLEVFPCVSDGPTSVFIAGKDTFSSESSSIGIIGGADGPTSIYVSTEQSGNE